MFFKNPLDKKFVQWARGKKVLPSNASAMKEKFLSSARVPAGAVKQARSRRFYWRVLSSSFAVILLLVVVDLGRQKIIKNRIIDTVGYDNSPGYTVLGLGKKEMPRSLGGNLGYASYSEKAAAPAYNEDGLGITAGATGLGSKDIVIDAMEKIGRVTNIFSSAGEGVYKPQNYYNAIAASVNDTREFSKVDYNANLKTRDVEDVSTRILTIVRGSGGRVDDASLQEKYSYISFVVPKDNLLQFKTEIKSLVGKKFYVESLHIQNLLPEKVGIEDSTKTYNKLLSDSQIKLNDLNVKHAKTIADLQRQLNNINGSIAKLKAEVTTDPERQKQIKTEIASLTARKGAVQKQISDENTWYGWDNTRLEQDVKNNQTQLDNLGAQEKNLLDNVETVQGYVSVQWMSVWQMINIYIPYLWVWVIGVCVLLLIFNYFSKRRTISAW